MKINSRKLLLFLYFLKKAKNKGISYAEIALVFPQLSESGHRALIFQLSKKRLIQKETATSSSGFLLTALGEQYLLKRYEFLKGEDSSRQDATILVIEKEKSSYDPGFRRLHALLKRQSAIHLKKGIFSLSQTRYSVIEKELLSYLSEIVCIEVGAVVLGQLHPFLSAGGLANEWEAALSGFSNEISQLIAEKTKKQSATYQSKINFLSVWERFFWLFESFPGIDSLNQSADAKFQHVLAELPKIFP